MRLDFKFVARIYRISGSSHANHLFPCGRATKNFVVEKTGKWDGLYIWDCLAAGYLIDPSFVTRSEKLYLDVESTFGRNYGAVRNLDRKLAPEATAVEVMLALDVPKFFGMYKDLLTRH